MKIELKDLAHYLPYGLKCHAMGMAVAGTEYDDFPKPMIYEIVGLGENYVYVKCGNIQDAFVYDDIFPILQPLSSVSDINSPFMCSINTDMGIEMEICDLAKGVVGFWNCSQRAIQVMAEHHIDFLGLIDLKLAIDAAKAQVSDTTMMNNAPKAD